MPQSSRKLASRRLANFSSTMIFGHPKYTNEKLVKLCVNGKILGLMSRRRSRRRRSTNNSVLTFIHLVALLDSQL